MLMSERSFHGGGGAHSANAEVGDALDEQNQGLCCWKRQQGGGGEENEVMEKREVGKTCTRKAVT